MMRLVYGIFYKQNPVSVWNANKVVVKSCIVYLVTE
jgi:hypothetical protein